MTTTELGEKIERISRDLGTVLAALDNHPRVPTFQGVTFNTGGTVTVLNRFGGHRFNSLEDFLYWALRPQVQEPAAPPAQPQLANHP